MKLFKKARELLDRITGKDDGGPPSAPAVVTNPVEQVLDPRYRYRHAQRDLDARMRITQAEVVHNTTRHGTLNAGRNKDKRKGRAVMISRGASPRVAKRKQRDGVEFDAVAA